MKLKHTFLAAMLLSPLTPAATTSGQTDVSRQESTQRADSAQQNLQQQAGQWGLSADDYQRYQQLMKGPRVPSRRVSIRFPPSVSRRRRRQSAVSLLKSG